MIWTFEEKAGDAIYNRLAVYGYRYYSSDETTLPKVAYSDWRECKGYVGPFPLNLTRIRIDRAKEDFNRLRTETGKVDREKGIVGGRDVRSFDWIWRIARNYSTKRVVFGIPFGRR